MNIRKTSDANMKLANPEVHPCKTLTVTEQAYRAVIYLLTY